MSTRFGEVRILFGTEDRVFRLTPVRWAKVQELTDAGPPEIARRLRYADWRIQDVRAVLLHGLIGGGMDEEDAELLCRELVDERALTRSVEPALKVVIASLFGPDDEASPDAPAGEPEGSTKAPRTRSPTARSASRKSGASPRS